MYVNYATHWTPSHPCIPHSVFLLKVFSLLIRFLLPSGGLGLGGVKDIWPVKPFETVAVIKGYTTKI